jgi:hypothetical protein
VSLNIIQADTRSRLYSTCVSLLKDVNLNILNPALDLIQIFIEDKEIFLQFGNYNLKFPQL